MRSVPKRRLKCVACDHPFKPGSVYISQLKEDIELSRFDYCCACWEEVDQGIGSYWMAKWPDHPTRDSHETHLLALLDRYVEGDKKNGALARLLAEMLKRKGLLRCHRLKTGDLFEDPLSGKAFSLPPFKSEPNLELRIELTEEIKACIDAKD